MAEAGARTATPTAGLDPVGMPREAIRVAGVQFGYARAGRLVFTGLDLELPAGRSTAVVGINGAGKTTLVKLLTRLHFAAVPPSTIGAGYGAASYGLRRYASVDRWSSQPPTSPARCW